MPPTILRRPKGGLVARLTGAKMVSGFRLAEGEVILNGVEVRLAEESPAGLVKRLGVRLLGLALCQRQGSFPRCGTERGLTAEVFPNIGPAQR